MIGGPAVELEWMIAMNQQSQTPSPANTDPNDTIGDPIAFLVNEHARQKEYCDRLDRMVSTLDIEPVANEAQEILDFLSKDLPLHVQDEERDLFPLLQDRCGKKSETAKILKQLSNEHDLDGDLVDFLIDDLRKLASGRSLPNPARLLINLKEFVETQRRHLAWEDRTILATADQVLSTGDRAHLAAAFRARRV